MATSTLSLPSPYDSILLDMMAAMKKKNKFDRSAFGRRFFTTDDNYAWFEETPGTETATCLGRFQGDVQQNILHLLSRRSTPNAPNVYAIIESHLLNHTAIKEGQVSGRTGTICFKAGGYEFELKETTKNQAEIITDRYVLTCGCLSATSREKINALLAQLVKEENEEGEEGEKGDEEDEEGDGEEDDEEESENVPRPPKDTKVPSPPKDTCVWVLPCLRQPLDVNKIHRWIKKGNGMPLQIAKSPQTHLSSYTPQNRESVDTLRVRVTIRDWGSGVPVEIQKTDDKVSICGKIDLAIRKLAFEKLHCKVDKSFDDYFIVDDPEVEEKYFCRDFLNTWGVAAPPVGSKVLLNGLIATVCDPPDTTAHDTRDDSSFNVTHSNGRISLGDYGTRWCYNEAATGGADDDEEDDGEEKREQSDEAATGTEAGAAAAGAAAAGAEAAGGAEAATGGTEAGATAAGETEAGAAAAGAEAAGGAEAAAGGTEAGEAAHTELEDLDDAANADAAKLFAELHKYDKAAIEAIGAAWFNRELPRRLKEDASKTPLGHVNDMQHKLEQWQCTLVTDVEAAMSQLVDAVAHAKGVIKNTETEIHNMFSSHKRPRQSTARELARVGIAFGRGARPRL